MNLSYIKQLESGDTSGGLRFSIEPNQPQSKVQHSSTFPTPSFRPYNHFIQSAPRGLNRLITSSKSAFKPVEKRCQQTKTDSTICSAVPCYCHLMNRMNIVATADTTNIQQQNIGISVPQSNESYINEDLDTCSPLNLTKNNRNYEIPSTSQNHTAIKGNTEDIQKWHSPSKMTNDSQTTSEVMMPPKEFHTRKSHLQKKSTVPVIDLTLNDDIEQAQVNSSRSIIELNVTPPLDMNGNEILITTNTKTMQAIAYNKPTNSKKPVEKNRDNILANSSKLSDEKSMNLCPEDIICPILYSNLTKMGIPAPISEPSKYDINYNRWKQYIRSYNGFRLFSQRNHMKLRSLGVFKGTKENQITLLNWWNSMSLIEKEQYAQIAELKSCKPFPKQWQIFVKERSISDTSMADKVRANSS